MAFPLIAYPLSYAMRGPQSVHAIPSVTQNWSENLAAFVLHTGNAVAGNSALARQIGWAEMTTWFGWPLCIALAVAAIVRWRDSLAARIAVLTAVTFTAFALGNDITIGRYHTGVPGPWIIVDKLLLFGMMPPGRVAYAVIGSAAVLLAGAGRPRVPDPERVRPVSRPGWTIDLRQPAAPAAVPGGAGPGPNRHAAGLAHQRRLGRVSR